MKYLLILLLLVSCSNVDRSPAIEEDEPKKKGWEKQRVIK